MTNRGGGIEAYDYELALRLSRRRSVKMIGPFRNNSTPKNLPESLEVVFVHYSAMDDYPPSSLVKHASLTLLSMPIYSILLAVKLLPDMARKKVVAIVHNGLPGLTAAIIAKITENRVVFSEGNTSPWANPYVKGKRVGLVQKFAKFANRNIGVFIAALSESVRVQSDEILLGMVGEGVDLHKIHVIPAAVEVGYYARTERHRPKPEGVTVGFIGRLTQEKELPLLLDVIRQLGRIDKDIRFVVLGGGPFASLIEKEPNVSHIGQVSHDELPVWLDEVDMVIYLQKDIGLGLLESMAAGKPVVASDAGNNSKLVKEGETGLLVRPDPNEFVHAIMRLAQNRNLREEISNNAVASLLGRFDWNSVITQWILMLEGEDSPREGAAIW